MAEATAIQLANESCAAEGSLVCKSWEELAARIKGRWEEAVKNTNAVFYGGMALGALIVTFAERPEIAAEAESAKQHRRGPKYTTYGWVAAELARRAGGCLPSAKHMVACARAAEIARREGITGGDVHALLGWKPGSLPQVITDATLPRLPGAADDTPAEEAAPLNGPEFTQYALVRLRVFERFAQDLAAKKPRGYHWPYPEGRDEFKKAVKTVNLYLKHLNLALVDRA